MKIINLVEIFYLEDTVIKKNVKQVMDTNPLNIIKRNNYIGFRYYEVHQEYINGGIASSSHHNISNMYYFGIRINDVIRCNNGYMVTDYNPFDKTIDECKESYKIKK